MSLEELLKQQENGREIAPPPRDGKPRGGDSLLRQAEEMAGQAAAPPAERDEADREPLRLPDGYVRRSPVQVYQTAEDYGRRRARRAGLIALGVVVAALVLAALVKSGFVVFRFR